MGLLPKFFIIISLLLSAPLRAEIWTDYTPINQSLKAKLMTLSASKEITLITQKFQQAISKDLEWFRNYANQLKPGEKMPYHEKMGITRAEYEMVLNPKSISLKENDTFTLEFKWKEPNKSIIINTVPTSPIDGIIIEKDAVTTPYGVLTQVKKIHNANKNSPTGPWSGIGWKLNTLDDQATKDLNKIKGKAIQFNLGKLESTKEGILYYDVKDINAEKNTQVVFSYISYYPLGK